MDTPINPGFDLEFRVLTFPLMIIGGMGSYFLLSAAGMAPFLASVIPVVTCVLIIRLLETMMPYREEWSATSRELKTDFSYLVLVQGVAAKILALGFSILLTRSGLDLQSTVGLWPAHWNILGQTALMIFLADLLRYWLHRASHSIPFLWRFHSIHHQPRKLYSLNVVRFHPAEKALQFTVDTVPFILLGVSADVIACYFVFYAINGFLQHCNLDLRFGFLNYIFSTSELHRWHHSRHHSIASCNFGNNLIIWDLLFGSYYLQRGRAPRLLGVMGIKPCGFCESLGRPFKGIFRVGRLGKMLRNGLIHLLYKLAKLKYWKPLERQCRDPRSAQNALLKNIMENQANTSFGVKHGFSEISSYQHYTDRVGIHEYEDLRPWFECQARQGTFDITSQTPLMYTQTSGSTGKSKYIPVTRESLNGLKASQAISSLMMYQVCPQAFQGKMLGIVGPTHEGYNEWGKACGSTSGLVLQSMPSITRANYLLPPEVYEIEDYDVKSDLILLYALAEPGLSFIGSANPSTLLCLLNRLNERRQYYLDILSQREPEILDSRLRLHQRGMLTAVRCREQRLRELKTLFASDSSISFADLWPELRLVVTWTGGSCGIPLSALARMLPASCKVMELGYIASEFRGTITCGDAEVGIPTLHENFFEFVEKGSWEDGRHEFLRLHEIEEGRDYYVFVTNRNGLYRYDINDIVRVNGRFKNTPCLEFVQKGRGITNITGEKLSEAQLGVALGELSRDRDIHPAFYVCLADATKNKYHLYLETAEPVRIANAAIGSHLERSLSAQNIEYRAKRSSRRLSAIAISLLKSGTFERYKKFLVNRGQCESQFKVMTLQYASENHFPFTQYVID